LDDLNPVSPAHPVLPEPVGTAPANKAPAETALAETALAGTALAETAPIDTAPAHAVRMSTAPAKHSRRSFIVGAALALAVFAAAGANALLFKAGTTVSALWLSSGGAIVSLLLLVAVRALTLTEERATLLARRMTEELAESEAHCRLLYEASPAMLHSINRSAVIVAVSNAWLERLGYARSEVLGRRSTDFLTPASKVYATETVLPEFFRTGRCTDVEYQMVCRDGSVIDVLLSAVLTPGEHAVSLAYMEDVTERRRAEREAAAARARMWEVNERLAAILDSAGAGIIATDPQGGVVSFNAEAERMLGYHGDEVLGRPLTQLIHVEEELNTRARSLSTQLARPVRADHETLFARAEAGSVDQSEWTYVRKDGSRFPVAVSVSAIRTAEGRVRGFICVAIDISSQRAHAQLQRTALREKETLLKEVYHRVKNNLQVVSSLFNLQLRALPEGPARQVLQQSSERVRAMALVHEKLCRSDLLQSIDIVSYVHDLCGSLAAANAAAERGIRIELCIEPIEIGLEASIPLGLLLNELICNSLKHGYPDGRTGTVTVRLGHGGPGRGLLEVSDDGVGYSAGMLAGKPTSLGLRLVMSLARQLGSRFVMETRGGAYSALIFDLAQAGRSGAPALPSDAIPAAASGARLVPPKESAPSSSPAGPAGPAEVDTATLASA
jgi:PAS domain S-box-containing protein